MEDDTNATSDLANRIPFDLVQSIVKLLDVYTPDQQRHVIRTVCTWLRLEDITSQQTNNEASLQNSAPMSSSSKRDEYKFSGRNEIGPKEFLLEKQPTTDVERMACLAYYLTHFRQQNYYKTEDLSKINTEAAQRMFANASNTAKNAVRDGFFVPAPKKGLRQLSALGEQYVQALPDRHAAMELRNRMSRRRIGRGRNSSTTPLSEASE